MTVSDVPPLSENQPNRQVPPLVLRSLARTLRLNLLWQLVVKLSGRSIEEEPKIVFHKSRPRATFCCILHLVPVTIAILLLYINITERFIGYNLHGYTLATTTNLQLCNSQQKLTNCSY